MSYDEKVRHNEKKKPKITIRVEKTHVTIGKNTILIEIYEKHKPIFNIIEQTNDQGWAEKINQHELNQFIKELETK